MKSKTALIRGGIFLRSRRALWMRDQQHDALRISRRLREVIADTIRERTDVPRSGFEPSVMPLSWWKKRRSRPPRVASMGSMTRSSAKC